MARANAGPTLAPSPTLSVPEMSAQPRHGVATPQLASAYEHKPSLELAGFAAAKGAGAGLLVSSVQNALDSHSRGAMGVLTRSGSTIGLFGAPYLFDQIVS